MLRVREETMVAVRQAVPPQLWRLGQMSYRLYRQVKYNLCRLPSRCGETSKAHARRQSEKFFHIFCQGRGLDVGYGGDLLSRNCKGWDLEQGDAQTLRGVRDESFDFVYSGHTLEHMLEPAIALRNWWRVVKKGGYLILYVPHRDLYEKKNELPSRWNQDHKHFFLPDRDDPPATIGLHQLICEVVSGFTLVYMHTCDQDYRSLGRDTHSVGEYSIETVLRKDTQAIGPLSQMEELP